MVTGPSASESARRVMFWMKEELVLEDSNGELVWRGISNVRIGLSL